MLSMQRKFRRLKPLDDIDRSADVALRVFSFHNTLADFIKANATGQLGEGALQQLLDLANPFCQPDWPALNPLFLVDKI